VPASVPQARFNLTRWPQLCFLLGRRGRRRRTAHARRRL